jgi:streptogramin lyase
VVHNSRHDTTAWYHRRITPTGQISEYLIPPFQGNRVAAVEIAVGSDGNLWFTATSLVGNEYSNGFIGSATTAGAVTEFATSTPVSNSDVIALRSDGNIWFTEYVGRGVIGRITTH